MQERNMAEEKESGGAEWMQKLWRPAMGWMYMIICLADMLVFPVLWSLLQAMMHMPITQWNPLTLQGAGLFHIAMGAVLGISAFGRTQEKLAGTAANPTSTQTINTQNMTGNVAGGFGSGSTGGFGNGNNSSFGGAPAFGAPATGGFGGASGFGAATTPPSTSSGFGGGSFGGASSTPASNFGATTSSSINTPSINAKGQKVVPQDDQPPL
jgi:hypothetical protein